MSDYFFDESENGYGRVFVPRGAWRREFGEIVKKERVPVVRLSSSAGWRGTDLDFLRELHALRGIEIYSQGVRDASVISSLSDLELVELDCDLRTPVHLDALPKLQVVKATWKNAIASVLKCSGLRELNLTNWPSEDIGPLAHMARLERLDLTSRKLISLRGVESLQSLQWLDLYACTKLDALDPIGLCPKIRHLAITSTKRFKDISPIGSLESLRVLHLDDDGEFESLKPLLRCTLLEELSFFGTTRITDGKISVLEQFKHLRTLRFTPRRAYDRTRKEILAETPG